MPEVECWNSAQLIMWLGQQLGLPMDRCCIREHSEIDTTAMHLTCPQSALNRDTYMLAVADVQTAAQGRPSMRLWSPQQSHHRGSAVIDRAENQVEKTRVFTFASLSTRIDGCSVWEQIPP
jgi:hypothetical protein